MSILTHVLAFTLCVTHAVFAVGVGQRSALFKAVQPAGIKQCSSLPPLITTIARSRLDCSDQCVGYVDGSCLAFNLRQSGSTTCELLNSLTSNYTEVPGCTLYQVGYE